MATQNDLFGVAPTTPRLDSFDVILCNTSAGKDSEVMLDVLVEQCREVGVLDRMVVVHCDLGKVEWRGVRELAKRQTDRYGVRFEVVKREQNDLLDHVRARGMWPGPATRYCTSDHKRAPVRKLMTKLTDEVRNRPGRDNRIPVRILNCQGLRGQESSSRRKRIPFKRDDSASNGRRDVWEYLPIHAWTEKQVWQRIYERNLEYHFAYDLGMPRLSCAFCIFAPRDALMIAGHNNRKLLDEYCEVEETTGHKFRQELSLVQIRSALAAGELPKARVTQWGQCA